jgi:Tol biopolymer transport system component
MNIEFRLQKAVSSLEDSVGEREPRVLPSSRRVMFVRVAFAALMIGLTALVAIPAIRNASLTKIGTADQPEKRDDGGSQEDTGGVPTEGGSEPAPGRGQGKGGAPAVGASPDSRSRGSLPEGTIPQGFEIAFNRGEIHLMDAEGSNLRKLRAGVEPEWSPDGGLIAFTDSRFGGDIQFMKSDGSGLQNLRARGSTPTWSPDGVRLAFNWACDAQFGGTCDSPDGTENDCGPECGIGVVAPDGTGVRRLGNGIWPDWGPDGRIIFTDGTPVGPCHYRPIGNPFQQGPLRCTLPIWVMNADGSGRTRLPVDNAISPTWSHDGRRIAYFSIDGVFVANSDGTGIVKVAPAGFEDPSWSPDGLWLALHRFTEGCSYVGCYNIYLRGIDGSTERRLTNSNNDLFPAFSPRR